MYTTVVLCALAAPAAEPMLPGFHRSPWFGEQTREEWVAPGVRAIANAPAHVDAAKPTRLIVFATPNGNTIENTLGRALAPGADWHFDIQHVAAQIRKLREITPDENIVFVCTEAEGLSWPAWKKNRADGPATIRRVVDWARGLAPGNPVRVTLTCHSGGGSFVTGFVDAADAIPDFVDRIAYLDANYSYSDDSKHCEKFLAWLRGDERRRLIVIAYDDREITLNGKKVVGPDGGTFRATQRMLKRLKQDVAVDETKVGPFDVSKALNGRLVCYVHPNPQNKILHTVLVGEMNGVLQGLTDGEPATWGTFGGPRAYSKYVQPTPAIPARPADAGGGRAFMEKIATLNRIDREEAIASEILRGNFPDFLQRFHPITIKDKAHTAIVEVMPDYLAVGSNADWVRVPMAPLTAQRIADAWDCTLPTPKLVDAIDEHATVKLKPIPLTEAREAVATFTQHHDVIEELRRGKTLGDLVTGVKKDVVVTNRLSEKEYRVALYGWRQLDGKPIQPLTIVHVNWYVDYSHGVRLVKRTANYDGKPRDLRHLMYAKDTCGLLSDEGPVKRPAY